MSRLPDCWKCGAFGNSGGSIDYRRIGRPGGIPKTAILALELERCHRCLDCRTAGSAVPSATAAGALTTDELGGLGGFPKLRFLRLSSNAVTDVSIAGLLEVRSLLQ